MEIDDYMLISPMSQRMDLTPGQSYTGQITVTNPASATGAANYKVEVAPYGVSGVEYAADLTTQTGRTMLADWITIEEPEGTVEPNSVKKINFTIKVPENAPGGGQYAAILVSQDNGETKNEGVAINDVFEVASLIYAEVDGEIVHAGEILENNIPGFVTGSPITVSALVKNEGNVHETATIIIEATDVFTGEVIVEAEDKNDYYTELVMPETTRYIEREINEGLPALGIVHVEQTIYYNGGFSQEAKDVIICPVWFMIMILTVIVVVIEVIVSMIVRRRRKNKKKKLKQAVQVEE